MKDQLTHQLQQGKTPLATTSTLLKGKEQLYPLLSSLTLSFWRMRLLVERKVQTTPLKLLILQAVSKEEGVSPGEICQRFGLEFSRISRLLQSLEREGLLQRKRYPQDRRFLRLCLTEKGRQYLPEQTALVNKELHERLGGLCQEEVRELERMLKIVGEVVGE